MRRTKEILFNLAKLSINEVWTYMINWTHSLSLYDFDFFSVGRGCLEFTTLHLGVGELVPLLPTDSVGFAYL